MQEVSFIAFTQAGCALAARLARALGFPAEEVVSGPARFAEGLGVRAYESLGAWTAEHFASDEALVYVGAAGIAVRAIAPHVRDKFSDPAVVSIDEAGRFAVPLLSGHVGGANELARVIAAAAGGQAVVSTATDVNGLFAVDEWAARNNLAIAERALAKRVSAALLEGEPVGFADRVGMGWQPPEGIVQGEGAAGLELGFAVTLDEGDRPFPHTLHLVPRAVTVGVGCRRGCDPAVLEEAVDAALAAAHVSPRAVALLASIDVKEDEPAIGQLARKRGWGLRFYTADELAAVPGDFTASDFVKRTVGVDNVCERSALAGGGTLLLGKQPRNGTTVAIALVK